MWLNFVERIKHHEYKWKFKLVACLPLFSVLVAIDWISKWLINAYMHQGESITIIKGLLTFDYVINPGAAKGMMDGNPTFVITMATILTILIFTAIIFINDKKWLIGLTIFISGSFANLLARAWAPMVTVGTHLGVMGGVVDFIKIELPIFGLDNFILNIADIWVSLAIAYLVVCVLIDIVKMFVQKSHSKKSKSHQDQASDQPEAPTPNKEG
ncbi:signal peptidase II [Williamsoniiplasma lucivorax]|uniref:Lipoprotein signal peptidase n=1 Tax=Williamsoniiplasma lucivorax TaxID=209274 RepID=A0A2S5RDP5_9MOLU|nr:signal peptidase II [Williamsoniiplasma lucivorax]PPE05459.1 signal peptidase II [Williamsoniiplasma lucivorax]